MVTLKALFGCECADWLIFKGGTSLSKGFGVIAQIPDILNGVREGKSIKLQKGDIELEVTSDPSSARVELTEQR